MATVKSLSSQVLTLTPDADALFRRLLVEADGIFDSTPELANLILRTVRAATSLEDMLVRRIVMRLANQDLPPTTLAEAFTSAMRNNPSFVSDICADVIAAINRDPATTRITEPLLYAKGLHAIQTHRLAHWLWTKGRRDLALYLQSRSSEVFQTDIHPAAVFGHGIFLDHATGLVVGETAIVDDDVSILQEVTLGGTGNQAGIRHPRIRQGVLIGAGAKILGPIEIGRNARVGAGSVVIESVPANVTVAGVPARIIGSAGSAKPALDMNQMLGN